MKAEICECCGAKVVEYKHNFNAALANSLYKIYNFGKPIAISELSLTRNQWTNFQKLRYWDLVSPLKDKNGKRIGSLWEVTTTGVNFVEGKRSIFKYVWTFRGQCDRFEGELITFKEMHEKHYKKRPEYAQEAQAHIF
jgi:hypothetical protein